MVGSAHSLRGASANLGATELSDLCARLEAEAAGDDLSAGAGLVDDIDVELVRVRDALRGTRARL